MMTKQRPRLTDRERALLYSLPSDGSRDSLGVSAFHREAMLSLIEKGLVTRDGTEHLTLTDSGRAQQRILRLSNPLKEHWGNELRKITLPENHPDRISTSIEKRGAQSPSSHKRSRKAALPNETEIKIRSRPQVIKYSRILIAALQEVVDYDPARHHNQPPPELRIDDEDYLTEIRNLVAELRTLNALLETTRRQPKKAAHAVVNLTRHLDTFLSCYAKSLAKGAGWLTIGVIASLLYQAGVGQQVIANILSHAKLPH
jgi:hypothetical protein